VGVQKARVFRNGRSQAVRIPAEYRFKTEEVFIQRDPKTGGIILTEKAPRPSLDEIFRELDAAGSSEFELARDQTPPVDRDWM